MEDIRKLIDGLRNFNENLNVKDGVDSLFKEYPKLADIGTQEQYSQYLDTIFPNSKVKDIVYHASPNKFEKFKDPSSSGFSHIWFAEKPLSSQFGANTYYVLVNLQNPLIQSNSDYDKELKSFEAPTNPDWINNYHKTGELPKYKYDGTIRSSSVDKGKSITIRTPEQAYILGSKEDIEGFTRFVNK